MKIVTIVGARPQFIKASTISRELVKVSGSQEVIVHTGQHYDKDMSHVFFEELSLPTPKYNLGVGSAPHGQQTGEMLTAIEKVLLIEKPDFVLVYGDTNSTLAGALAAVKLHIAVAHVEAGLRSFNRRMPEEINRVLTDHSSDVLYAPTKSAMDNLRCEGIDGAIAQLTGDVMYDASLFFAEKATAIKETLKDFHLSPRGYLLATIHRAENTDNSTRLIAIFQALLTVSRVFPVVMPLHPRTRQALCAADLFDEVTEKLIILPPVGYLDMLNLERHAVLIVTDSGGVQKEAFFHRVPCVTLREETEWIELVETGWNKLLSPLDAATIYHGICGSLEAEAPVETPNTKTLYGGGLSAQKVVSHLQTLVI